MKRSVLIFAAVLAVFGITLAFARNRPNGGSTTATGRTTTTRSSTGAGAIGTQAANFSATDIMNNSTITLSNYIGKVVVLNFWATWCPPCRAEIPDLIQLHKKYAGKLVVIGASCDDSASTVKPFINQQGINYPIFMSTEAIEATYGGVTGIPATFIIDKTGKIVNKIVGSKTYEEFVEFITPYL